MVKCADCGFLAARNLGTRNLDEIEEEFRRSGNPPTQIIAGKEIGYYTHKRYPICFLQEYYLLDSFKNISGEESTRFLEVIDEERQCELFTKWRQGFTPKEHKEMMDREKMLEWQSQREDADKKWRDDQETKHSKEEWHRNIFMAVFGIVAGIVGAAIGAVITWLLTRGGN